MKHRAPIHKKKSCNRKCNKNCIRNCNTKCNEHSKKRGSFLVLSFHSYYVMKWRNWVVGICLKIKFHFITFFITIFFSCESGPSMCLHMLQIWLGTTSYLPTKSERSRRKLLAVCTSPGPVLQHLKTQYRALAPCYAQTLLHCNKSPKANATHVCALIYAFVLNMYVPN